MMRIHFFKFIIAAFIAALFHSTCAAADEHATRDEAVAFVKKAIAFIKQNGKEKAMAEFNNPQGQFVDRELYIVALDLNGMVLASGANSKLVGKPLLDIKDGNGKQFVREEIEVAKSKGKGWVDFDWVNPVTKKIEPRSVYLEKVDDYIVLSGVYQKR
jgi:signal transduction histidine kinase